MRNSGDWRFARLWTASTASALGSGVATIAAPLYVAAHTRSPLIVSATAVAVWVPWLLFALPGGVLVDRVDRRRLMVVIDWVRVAAMVLLGAGLASGWGGIILLDAVLFVISAGEVVFESASQTMIAAVVPPDRLERANGWLFGGQLVGDRLVAGPFGGFLIVVVASAPFFFNAGTYAVSAVLITLIPGTFRAAPTLAEPAPAGSPRRMLAEISEGFRWLAGQRVLRTMTGLIGLLNLTLTASSAVLVLLAKERFGLGAVGFGTLMACLAAGALAGSLCGDWVIRRVTASWTIRAGLVIEAAQYVVLAWSRNPYFAGATLFVFGIHAALWSIVGASLRQRLTPPSMLGRVSSTSLFISSGANCVGALLGGVVADRFGITAPYWAGFVVGAIVTALTWRVFDRQTIAAAYAAAPAADADIAPAKG